MSQIFHFGLKLNFTALHRNSDKIQNICGNFCNIFTFISILHKMSSSPIKEIYFSILVSNSIAILCAENFIEQEIFVAISCTFFISKLFTLNVVFLWKKMHFYNLVFNPIAMLCTENFLKHKRFLLILAERFICHI